MSLSPVENLSPLRYTLFITNTGPNPQRPYPEVFEMSNDELLFFTSMPQMLPLYTALRDQQAGTYHYEYLDRNTGCANAMHFVNSQGQDVIVGTNREIDEVALYTVTE